MLGAAAIALLDLDQMRMALNSIGQPSDFYKCLEQSDHNTVCQHIANALESKDIPALAAFATGQPRKDFESYV